MTTPISCAESGLASIEQAREAYTRVFCCNAEEVRSGKMDWSPWIKGYTAALHVEWREKTVLYEAALEQLAGILESAPELNMSNYDHDQVAELNDAMIEATLLARQPLSQGSSNVIR